jgi:hypothetical protein
MFDVSGKHQHILDTIESHFDVVEKHLNEQTQVCIIVFRPTAETRGVNIAIANESAGQTLLSAAEKSSNDRRTSAT